MSKFVVVVFPDEAKSYEGTRALKELHAEGSLTLYGMAVVARDAKGVMSVKQAGDSGPLGFGVGSLVGGLVGLLGGPAGAAIGMASGATIGGLTDIFNAGVGADFVRTVSDKVPSGKAAVVAEVDEEWVTPLDTRMEALGGTVIRERRSDFEDEQIDKETKARRAELAQLRSEFNQAKAEKKASLKTRIAEAKTKLTATSDRAQKRMDQLQQEVQAKVKELQDQEATATAEAKTRISNNISDIRSDHNRRIDRMKQVWEQTKKDLAA